MGKEGGKSKREKKERERIGREERGDMGVKKGKGVGRGDERKERGRGGEMGTMG